MRPPGDKKCIKYMGFGDALAGATVVHDRHQACSMKPQKRITEGSSKERGSKDQIKLHITYVKFTP